MYAALFTLIQDGRGGLFNWLFSVNKSCVLTYLIFIISPRFYSTI